MRADRHLERGTRLVVLSLRGIKHGEVVVRLRQLGKFLRELGEDLDRVVGFVLFGENKTSHEAPARILGLALQKSVDALQCAVELALLQQLARFLQFVGLRGCRRDDRQRCCEDRNEQKEASGSERHVLYFSENISSLAAKSSKFYQEQRVFHTPTAGVILGRPGIPARTIN